MDCFWVISEETFLDFLLYAAAFGKRHGAWQHMRHATRIIWVMSALLSHYSYYGHGGICFLAEDRRVLRVACPLCRLSSRCPGSRVVPAIQSACERVNVKRQASQKAQPQERQRGPTRKGGVIEQQLSS